MSLKVRFAEDRSYLRHRHGVKNFIGLLMYQIRTLRILKNFVPCFDFLRNAP